MISVEEAEKIILDKAKDFGIEEIALEDSMGRVLREDIQADRDFPPYDRVTMDGIAIRFDAFENGVKEFKIAGIAAAGDEQKSLREKGKCLEVMTGAIMPDGLDTVIPYEMIEIKDNTATINTDEVNYKQNIHFKGLDRKKDDTVILSGKKISSAEVGVCATVGKAKVKVSALPKTIIISSGDELVNIDQSPERHQIRKSNVYRLQTVLKNFNLDVDTHHINDNLEEVKEAIRKAMESYDLVILSGGVSKGKFDYIPQAMDEIGVEKHFHRIAQRPGKPFWFGSYQDKVTVFAFPGNPVSSFMCMTRYFVPWLKKCTQENTKPYPNAILSADVEFKPDLTYFLEVDIDYSEKGEILAKPIKGNGSGDLANLVDADAFVVLPRGKDLFKKGEVYPIIFYR